ncbi:hypothetical protein Ais01nite_79250 [Asanoa ishikariensis]|uniref:Uncharacterized protein n=1 Tax=Asanoa ishikariensis TaxID=137265 RepID=A0A1H3KIL1_9ACTN|nr:hypothetical protein [Asanoa ishikariensis]GIF69890.1 hypothetical protein Ais01nite_79250 [Asanoa ishikariensis]SDY51424.1 hypothetical protein SAMN05421684_0141 [Asanoa ishikariensis]
MSEPDFDLLADYIGGALVGTPEHERVAALVATDPDWAREHDLLLAALEATADDLAIFAEQTAEPMPDDVLLRLLAALPATSQAGSEATSPAAPTSPASSAATDSTELRSAGLRAGPARENRAPGGRRPEAGPRPASRPRGGRQRPRWLAWAAPVLVAVAVAAFAGLWINQSVGTGTNSAETTAGAADSAAQAPNAAGGDAALAIPRYATGRDYNGAAVGGGLAGGSTRAQVSSPSPGVMSAQGDQPERANAKAVEPELLRLDAAAALAVCVDAIAQAHGQGPITVSAADFASYQGRPAVMVFFTDSAGVRWGWAVGPDCGPGGTDELFRARVG